MQIIFNPFVQLFNELLKEDDSLIHYTLNLKALTRETRIGILTSIKT